MHFVKLTKNLANMHMWVITMLCIWIKRSDGSVEAQQFGELLKRVRYGKFETSDFNELKNLSATEKDVETDPAWRSKSTLTDVHFYSEEHPERSNAHSRNAKALN